MNQNAMVNLIPLIIMFVIFYFFLIRPQKKKANEVSAMRENLKVGDKVITIGGIIGKIVLVKEDYLVIETSTDNTKIEIMKWGINGTYKNNKELKDSEEE
ncbi:MULTISPECIES: preprotein translocase subunit YajC [Peptoniphilus]|uniref:preprotein translocase subunit YajC n=1 Tax=Peptoniphilus TaxID=162289 RepID=UPI000288F1E1|nr:MULTISPECIES: preprotein translocase subunit YajC [Peptoniphilus]MBS6610046.1 preprotein translocase subunit YajC [Peptoniphilus harei]MDU1043466.1 preprotein translocase subunit YajC [Peptoniphilus rhinitidis]MDU1954181.1 preprotein translocase subunit YajC [Peptoniphilus lacydonensis]MDU2109666.1 preprotein translocase subunit YajC [Peptoniphilus lacydonensis]MDU2115540.1 preprotein translocase subunit YajC [Peptoniphilus lacydonensis]